MEDTIHYQLLASHLLFRKIFLKRIKTIYPELLPGQPKVIDFLIHRGSACQREIAEACLLEPPTLIPILEKMEKAGLIKREKRPENRKNSIVTLSEKGVEIGKTACRVFAELENEFCGALSKEEREVFSAALKKFCDYGKGLLQ